MPVLSYIVTALVAYLLGSIPTGFLVAKARGIDIRTVGSGNIGATNAFRILGKGPGILVLFVDALKGFVAVVSVVNWYPELYSAFPSVFGVDGNSDNQLRNHLGITAGITAILGHNYTCWLHFKGGKGIATTAGVLLGLMPWALAIILSIWIILFLTTRYVSVGSIVAAFALPFAAWFTTHDSGLTVVAGVMGGLAIYKHRKNIRRLLDGTENRVQFKKKEAAS